MLAFGLASLGLSAFLFWVMMQGDNFITSTNWSDAVQQVINALKNWLSPNSSSKPSSSQTEQA